MPLKVPSCLCCPPGTTVEGTVTSAGGTRTVGCTGALRTASPTSPSKSLSWGGWPFHSPLPTPCPVVEYCRSASSWIFADPLPGPWRADHSPPPNSSSHGPREWERREFGSEALGTVSAFPFRCGSPASFNSPNSLGIGWGKAQHSPGSSTFSPLLPCFSAPCVIKMWLAWDDFRSGLWPPQVTRKAIWSTCWTESPTRVPPVSSQGTSSSSLAVVSSPPPKGKWERGWIERRERSGLKPKDGTAPCSA